LVFTLFRNKNKNEQMFELERDGFFKNIGSVFPCGENQSGYVDESL
jgi:hypothetical protein